MCLILTSGEPSGIGPDLVISALYQQDLPHDTVVIADPDMLQQRAKQMGFHDLKLVEYSSEKKIAPNNASNGNANTLNILPLYCETPVVAGELNVANANYVLKMLQTATLACLDKQFSAMVTGPIHKGIINDAGIKFTGHTEFLAEITATELPVMMLVADKLRVALVTTHLPLSAVSATITPDLLTKVIQILQQDLIKKFGISNPTILVCGLNPHAGEGGHLGWEEIEIIEPTLHKLRQQGIKLVGPLPADTLFTPKYLENADAVLAMYHDQGLPVLKYVGFGHAINITLGLPIIRTSVDHGTALDLAGTGKAKIGSLLAAIKTAQQMTKS